MYRFLSSSHYVILKIAFIYAVVAKISFLFTIPPGNVSPIFPASGIALASVLILKRNALAGIWLGSFIVNTISFFDGTVSSPRTVLPALLIGSIIGIGAMSGAKIGAFLACRFNKDGHSLYSGRNVFMLVVSMLGSCMVSPTLGVASLSLGGYIAWERFGYSWITWWAGDVTGAIIAAPLILAWHYQHPFRKNTRCILEMAALGMASLLLCYLIFFRNVPFAYGLIPLLLWAAFRFGMRGVSTTAAAIAIFATIGVSHGVSPFAKDTVNKSLLSLHSFLDVTIICALFLAGVLADRKRAEEASRKSELKYRELVENANSIILYWACDGRIIFLNEFGQKFFGYSAVEIIGRHVIGSIVPETDSTDRNLRPLMEQITANPKAFEQNVNENIRRNGERVWIAWTNRAVQDEQGRIIEVLSIGHDITEHKQADEEIRRLNEDLRHYTEQLEQRVAERTAELVLAKDRAESADRLKSTFLATMSHELRTPLNSIIGFTGILLQNLAGPLNMEQHKQLEMVRNSARHLLALINDVLDISKIEAGQLEVKSELFNLRAAILKVAGIVKPLAEKKTLALCVEIAPEIGSLANDPRRTEQVLLNLLNNAIKFTERGAITLTADIVSDTIRIAVADTGIGIKPDDLNKLFQPFRQIDSGLMRHHEGTGLGLFICRRLADLLGGEIFVASDWGKGSVFTFTLPMKG
jgi:PAS domain S-box-containing protein